MRSDSTATDRPRIRHLSEILANQIAAGEVVERPASVLKELLENSLDAGATRIRVEARQGGMSLLRITDNGVGIHRDDLALALSRHATSKITNLEELERVRSLGFRGEALASIASVSRLRLESCNDVVSGAWSIESQAGEAARCMPCSHPRGTTVEVRDLFFNTPVRRRFMKTEATEYRHLEAVLRRYALACPQVAFNLVHNDRLLIELNPALNREALRNRRVKLCGRAFEHDGHELSRSMDGLQLHGHLCSPALRRDRADSQYLFVNGRAVNDTVIRHAVRQAFETVYGPGGHPGYLLFLELPPEGVDVNVHPTKQEVRFREPRMIHDFVRSSILHSFSGVRPNAGIDDNHDVPQQTRLADGAAQLAAEGDNGNESASPWLVRSREAGNPTTAPRRLDRALGQPSQYPSHPIYARAAQSVAEATSQPAPDGIVGNRFLVRVDSNAVHVVDLRAVRQARILTLLQAVIGDDSNECLPSRPLLLPCRLTLDKAQARTLQDLEPILLRLGLRLRFSAHGRHVLLTLPLRFCRMAPERVAAQLQALAHGPQSTRRLSKPDDGSESRDPGKNYDNEVLERFLASLSVLAAEAAEAEDAAILNQERENWTNEPNTPSLVLDAPALATMLEKYSQSPASSDIQSRLSTPHPEKPGN